MNRLLPLSLLGATVALTLAASTATSAPAASQLAGAGDTAHASTALEPVHYRYWRHRHRHHYYPYFYVRPRHHYQYYGYYQPRYYGYYGHRRWH